MDTTRERILERIRMRPALPPPARRAELRKNAGLSQQDLGEVLGVSAMSIHFWETGKRLPKPEHAQAYLEALQVLEEQLATDRPAAA
jgi:transcriptional regulator with XRE-family HTH domain